MATSEMSYAVHYDLSRGQDGILQDFSRMRIETNREPPVLYVAMATWIPRCNQYNNNSEVGSPTPEQDHTEQVKTDGKIEVENVSDVDEATTDKPSDVTPIKTTPELDPTKQVKTDEKIEVDSVKDKLSDVTPKKAMSPKQLKKKLESEKKRREKQLEREERDKQKQEEKERTRLEKESKKQEKDRQKQEKEEQKAKEREQKRKEREEKETKRKEREERDEAKRKEREQEKLRKQQELDEKNKEKQKLEEQKQKAAAAFVNFFVAKKPEIKTEGANSSLFMPFQVKSDMRLAPIKRRELTEHDKQILADYLNDLDEDKSYLKELKRGGKPKRCGKTFPYDDDVIIVEEDFGERICEDKPKMMRMQVKFLKFHENRRPAYYGTWRKRSKVVNARKPFVEDEAFFDYKVESDDDWEEEEQGESLNGSDDEDKENEVEDEYEVDNDFFVPHGHLSDDEVDDEATSKLSPESLKQKLKLLKDEFDQDMQAKTHKMKPRSIGCIWYNKDGSNVEEAVDRYLRPFAVITNGPIIIKKRSLLSSNTPIRKFGKKLREDFIPAFVRLVHGNVKKKAAIANDFIANMEQDGGTVDVSRTYLAKCVKDFAQWRKCAEEGPLLNKMCWCVDDEFKKKYNVE